MASQLHASGPALPRLYSRTFAIFPARYKGYLLPALCLLLFFATGCSAFSTSQAGQGNGSANTNTNTKITYVAIGASDAFGIGTDDPYNENWPTDLMNLLGANHIHLIDAGVPGILTHDALSLELPIALDAHPRLVTIWLGVNDIAANVPVSSYARDLQTLVSRLRAAAPNASIAIANIPDLTILPYFSKSDPLQLTRIVQQYNAAIVSAVQQYHLILVDLTQQNYNLKAHPEYISDDGLHPNSTGYQQLAKLFYEAIQAAQKQATTP
ncbi:MAG TPA: SGNH/GDSL hydrolase family protein [Ktedonobacteraceae bacterium]|nr:SGNH/GDSL hydrolase family protein [Ktedonobacteraceae bacterium]